MTFRKRVRKFTNCHTAERIVQFENEMATYNSITEQSTFFYVLTVSEHNQMQNDAIACTVL